MPGCSLCMGNQARVGDKTTVVSTSTRNFPNRLGKGANVYLASGKFPLSPACNECRISDTPVAAAAELAAVSAIVGKLPTPAEYLEYAEKINTTASDTYRYLNFHQLPDYVAKANNVKISVEATEAAKKLYGK
eukprot:260744-Rhodomonas_salina.5